MSGTCRTCPIVDKLLSKTSEKSFLSKNTISKLQQKILKIEDETLSFDDLRNQWPKDYPKFNESLICIPSSTLLKYPKKIPYFVTEDDTRLHLTEMLDEIMKVKKDTLESSETTEKVNDIFNRFKDKSITDDEASDKLNAILLEIIFVEDKYSKASCKICQKENVEESCCHAKLRLKETYRKWRWPQVLKSAKQGKDIMSFAKLELEKNSKKLLKRSPTFDVLSKITGQKGENFIQSKLRSHLNVSGQAGILIGGFRVYSSLKNLLNGLEIKLKGCHQEKNQVEHDNLTIIPVHGKVRINFNQAKTTLQSLHSEDKEKNIVSACEKAFGQLVRDVETFKQIMEHFLTHEEFDKIDFGFSVSITSLEGIPEDSICLQCRNHIFETSKEYSDSEEKQLLGIDDLTPHTDATIAIFQTIATLYIGSASIVELKTFEEGYKKESKRMDHINENMKKLLSCKMPVESKMIRLGPEQNSIFLSRFGQSYAVIAPWGGGKSTLLELELQGSIDKYNETKEPVNVFLVVYEMKATRLLKHYQTFVADLAVKKNINIEVMNLKEICNLVDIKYETK